MKIRRFFAKDMRTGLADISKEMGPDAAILSTNKVKGGIEIVAATDYEQSLLDSRRRLPDSGRAALKHSRTGSKSQHSLRQETTTLHGSTTSPSTFRSYLKQESEKINNLSPEKVTASPKKPDITHSSNPPEIHKDEIVIPASESEAKNRQFSSTANDFQWGVDPVISGVKDELELIRGLLQTQLAELSWQKRMDASPVDTEILKRLVALGFPVSVAEKFCQQYQSKELQKAWYEVAASIASQIPIAEINPVEEGGCFAIVGPTGVGKTTTIAKLAAISAVKYGPESVAMISTDSYRIAAHEQLSVYGQIMGVKVVTVSDAESLNRSLNQLSDRRLILIDTAGIGQRDKRLSEQVACLSQSSENIKNLLVLSTTAQLASLKESVQCFSELNLTGAILTKLDEATSLGPALTALMRTGLNTSFITDGQNVPDDIHPARAHQLMTDAINLANQYPPDSETEWAISQQLKRVG